MRYGLCWYGLICLGGLGILMAGVLVGINLRPVKRFLEQKLPEWSDGMVQVEGMRGTLPWHVSFSHLVLKDSQGVWLEGRDASLRLGLLALLRKQIYIRNLSADYLDYIRNPFFSSVPTTQTKSSMGLPDWSVQVDRLNLSFLTVGPTVFGQAARLRIGGRASLESLSALTSMPSFASMPVMQLLLRAERLDHPAHFLLDLKGERHELEGRLHYDEDARGFASSPGHLNILDPLVVDMSLKGPYRALSVKLDVKAATQQDKPLTVALNGNLDLVHLKDDLSLAFHAPPMTILSGITWETLDLSAVLHGDMLDPHGSIQLDGADMTASDSGVGHLHVRFDGQEGGLQAILARDEASFQKARIGKDAESRIALSARLDGVRIPGKSPTILASAPLILTASVLPYHAGRPYQIQLEHDAIRLGISGTLTSVLMGHVKLDVDRFPDVTAMIGQKLKGDAHAGGGFTLPLWTSGEMNAALNGHFALKEGPVQAVALIGDQGTLNVQVKRQKNGTIQLKQASLGGKGFQMDARADLDPKQVLSASLRLLLPDLKVLSSALRGHALLESGLNGPTTDLTMQTHLGGQLGVVHAGVPIPEAPLDLHMDLAHLPSQPQGTLKISGILDRSPLKMHMDFARRADGEMMASLDALEWKDLHGKADIDLPAGRRIPRGDVELRIARLDGFSHLMGRPISGHLQLEVHTLLGSQRGEVTSAPHDRLNMGLDGQLHMGGYAVNMVRLKGEIQHLQEEPSVDMALQVSGLKANEITGNLKTVVKGTQSALGVQADGAFDHVMKSPAHFSLAAQVDIPGQKVKLTKLLADLKGDAVRLLVPTVVKYGQTLGIEHLETELRPPHGMAGRVSFNGDIRPDLNVDARLDHITAALAEPFMPSLHVMGEVGATARLKGTMASPAGRIVLDGTGLRFVSEQTEALPAGKLHVQAEMDGKQVLLRTELRAGDPVAFLVAGKVPLSSAGVMDLTARGRAVLSVANAFLGANGMGIGGQVSLDLGIKGSVKKPQLTGSIQLHDGLFDQYADGVHLRGMEGSLTARGDVLNIDHFIAHAGQGTLGMEGMVGVLKPGIPIDLRFSMDKAQPIQSDMLTEMIDSRLHIHGQATTRIDVEGGITVPEASITLPDSMPASVPQLEIITSEQAKTVPRMEPKMVVGLNIDFISPGRLFVRGHGLFAEMQGKLHIGGVSTAPILTGGIDLKRGNFNLAGINLNFTRGQVGFSGASAAHKLDPTIDFRADRNANGTLASLLVKGYASNPKIDFVSTPSLPRDEVLSILLFGTDRGSLSSTQLASLGLAIVQIGGGSAFDPMGKVRGALGLDHLAIGGGNSVGNGAASVEAGKYVMKGVYVGAKEGLSGKGAQAQVKVDLTKRLQLNTTVGTGGQVTGFTTPENDPGSSIGLSYGIDY
ncbi:translocation/assembly module TamB domain-containing protein [Bombella sp. TMW 2.2559]|uniref:Translocation/assembly module TamB domain-containing protein n=1 Tax=Bombella dulcis TaxID=2967339 RepID=A0ABT3WDE3_9PROT|nr:translocation/assembly module TamB domain-containing protein [Bombella dulcis]MCX5615812.1 translocation/assembly module TamB domain-containing protein [Bombella dulcis]